MGNLFDLSAIFASCSRDSAAVQAPAIGQPSSFSGQPGRGSGEGDKARQCFNTAEKALYRGIGRQIDVPLGRTGDVAIDGDVSDSRMIGGQPFTSGQVLFQLVAQGMPAPTDFFGVVPGTAHSE